MSKISSPTISVLMPAYNAEKYLAAAVESILNQNHSDFELIIIDDGSTDSTGKIIQNYAKKDRRVAAVQNEHQGICPTLNRGVEIAHGQYIARMDADDWSYPQRLARQFNFMESQPKVVICGGQIEICDENLKTLNTRGYPTTDKEIRKKIFRLNPFAHPATMYRTEAARKVGGYNPHLQDVEDYDFYFRLGKLGQFANLSQTVLKLRIHPSSISSQKISRQARLNLYVRLKAMAEYGYKTSWQDKAFLIANVVGLVVIPPKLKFKLFNFLRRIYH